MQAKGVVCKIVPKEEMPVDANGIRADAIMDQKSVASRMNSGKLYDGYITSTARKVKRYVEEQLKEFITETNGKKKLNLPNTNKTFFKNTIEPLWKYILDYLKILEVQQYEVYSKCTNTQKILEVITEIVEHEFYVMFPIDNKKTPHDIVADLINTPYHVKKTPITFTLDGITYSSEDPIAIETVYMLVLSKIADTGLAASTAKINHFGVPISTSKANKKRQPWNPNPVKTGETETRLYASYAGREALAELRDRSASVETHKHIYGNILRADKPTAISKVVDRSSCGWNGDKPVNLLEAILNVGGVETIYVEENEE